MALMEQMEQMDLTELLLIFILHIHYQQMDHLILVLRILMELFILVHSQIQQKLTQTIIKIIHGQD